MIKKCKYCGKAFIPGLQKLYDSAYTAIFGSINEINFCARHFPPQYGVPRDEYFSGKPCTVTIPKEKMASSLKKLSEIIGSIPPTTFHENYAYLEGLCPEKFDEAIKLINDMPPAIVSSFYQPRSYKDVFGSWLNALVESGVLKDGVRKTPRGYMCIANDGHLCRSLGEKVIDDWLYNSGIPHEKEVRYPGKRAFRADWQIGDYFIEFWGLEGQEDYDEKRDLKKKLSRKYHIPLIDISPNDLNTLNLKLKDIKTEYGGQKLPVYKINRDESNERIILDEDEIEFEKELMKINRMSWKMLKKFREAGINSMEDIKKCNIEDILAIKGIGKGHAQKLFYSVGRKDEIDFYLTLKNFPGVWDVTIKKLREAGITTLYQLSQCTIDDLLNIEDLGKPTAKSILEGIHNIPIKK